MPFLHFKKKSLLTLTMQDDEIRLLQLIHNKNGYSIEKMAIQTFKENEELITAFKKIIENTSAQNSTTAFALPANQIIQKTIKLSKEFKQKELYIELKENIASYISGIEEELSFDFAVVAENELEQVVLLTACRQHHVNEYLTLFRTTGLKLKIIDIDYYALTRAAVFPFLPKLAKTFVILEMKQDYFQFLLIRQSYIYFRQICPFAPETFLGEFQQHLHRIFKSLTALTNEIKYIIMAGHTPNHLNLREYIQEAFELPLLISNPFHEINVPHVFDEPGFENKMLVNLGLALRSAKC